MDLLIFLYGYWCIDFYNLKWLLTQIITFASICGVCVILLYKTYLLNRWLRIMLIALFVIRNLS